MSTDNTYCVYLHRRKDTGEVFYIGKGSKQRSFSLHYRNQDWHKVVEEAGGFTVELFADNLSEMSALLLESNLIESKQYLLVNKIEKFNPVVLRNEELSRVFVYDENSPTGLTRVSQTFNGIGYVGSIGPAGKMITKNGKQYYRVKFQDNSLYVHRIIWTLLKDEIPENMVIDHINGNSLDNRIDNLRCVSKKENSLNRKKKNKISLDMLPVGIFFSDDRSRIRASFSTNTKSFSINKYGEEKALELAIAWRKQKEIEYGFN